MLALLLASLLAQTAVAEDCDAKMLVKELTEATPISTPKAYFNLEQCDTELTKKHTGAAFEKILAGEEGNQAALSAVKLEQEETVRSWLSQLEPHERSPTITFLGKVCKKEEAVQGFFAKAHADLGEQFWKERWHRGLSDCRADSIQEILIHAIQDKDIRADQSRFFNVLEVYSRNLGAKAVPTLSALAKGTKDEEELTYLVNAFADAANVGGEEGTNPVAAKAAIAALTELGPTLPVRAVEGGRRTLMAMNAEEEADQFAKYRWRERMTDGNYTYAVTALESVACKNGKNIANFHVASFQEAGNMWPEQIQEHIAEKLVFEWEMNAAEKCKGTGTNTFEVSATPFESDEALQKWVDGQKKAFQGSAGDFDKSKLVNHEQFTY